MPRLSDTMEEGTILRWLKRDGEHVRRGEELVEIETDKANMTYESDQEGTLQIVAREGDTLAVGQTIAHIGEGGDGAVATAPPEETSSKEAQSQPTPSPAPSAERPAAPEQKDARVKASPVARRVARASASRAWTCTP